MALLRWVLAVPVIVICIFLALANREDIQFTYSPIHDPIEIPLSFTVLSALALGFVFGTVISWLSMGHLRKERRKQKKAIKQLQKDLDAALHASSEAQ